MREFKEVPPLALPQLQAAVVQNDRTLAMLANADEGEGLCITYDEALALFAWLKEALWESYGMERKLARYREALQEIYGHVGLPSNSASYEVLQGLLASIERIAGKALSEAEESHE